MDVGPGRRRPGRPKQGHDQAQLRRLDRRHRRPFDLLANDATWTIVGRSVVAKTYANREAFLTEVIRPFNACMREPLRPRLREIYAEGDVVIVLFDASSVVLDGEPYTNTYTWYLRMRGHRIVAATAFFDISRSTRCGRAWRQSEIPPARGIVNFDLDRLWSEAPGVSYPVRLNNAGAGPMPSPVQLASNRRDAMSVVETRRHQIYPVFIGADPNAGWLQDRVAVDPKGFVVTGFACPDRASAAGRPALPLETSFPGVFAIGDVRAGSTKRVAAAVGEGAAVVAQIHMALALQSERMG